MASKIGNALRIVPATDGGFIVLSEYDRELGTTSAPLFAGDLEVCLDYMRDKLTPPGTDCECATCKRAA